MSEVDYSSLKVAELRELCNDNSLPVSGKKAQLVERLTTHFQVVEAILEHEKSPNNFIELDGGGGFSSNSATFQRLFAEKAGPHTVKIIAAFALSLLMITAVLSIQPAWLGFGHELEFELIEYDESMSFDYIKGVKIVEVKKDSPANDNNIKRGDVITEIGKLSINNENDYETELDGYSKGDTIMLRIVRNGNPLYVAFEIE